MSNELTIFLLSMLPISELRGTIPLGIEVFGLHPAVAFLMAILGNAIPVFVLVFGLEKISIWCERNSRVCHRVLSRVFARSERVFKSHHDKYGALALFIFTAIPLPLTGVWSSSVAAVLFRIQPRYALPAILLGMLAAGIIVLFATVGVSWFVNGFAD